MAVLFWSTAPMHSTAQAFEHPSLVRLDAAPAAGEFVVAQPGQATAIYLDPADAADLSAAVDAFASDVARVSGIRPKVIASLPNPLPKSVIVVGVAGRSGELRRLDQAHRINLAAITDKWESALTTVVDGELVVAGSDRRGAAFALFTLSRQMGVSPWSWWADVPVLHHDRIAVQAHDVIQHEPSVRYRGIFLNDEDWGLRPWAAARMDPSLHNIGPNTYARVFQLLLRLHANSLWPAMHPGTLAFNAVPENAKLADKWGIVMGSSHSEALLRNNVGEWNETRDGPWNYQINSKAMDAYWQKRLVENGRYENFYTVGLRGVHDTGLEATGTTDVKARLVEQVMADQRALLAKHVNADVTRIPQVIWLYKESLALYRAGMKVPDDVALGWTDDNYGYIRQLSTAAEQKRPGGAGVYYHVSYWGFPHDYLWLCSTPPEQIHEEMTKAYDHNARRYWVLNVGDIKPAEADIDYFLQLAWDEPAMAQVSQRDYLQRWAAEQFPASQANAIADVMDNYYRLNFIRRPEFMGFNGYDDGINRTAFNPLAWGDQNRERMAAWEKLQQQERAIASRLPAAYISAFFELVGYPVEASAAQNDKFLFADRTYLDASQGKNEARVADGAASKAAFDRVQSLTDRYNALEEGKWRGMMSSAPRDRDVFKMPLVANASDANRPLPPTWSAGASPAADTVSLPAAQFSRKHEETEAHWNVLEGLGISGSSIEYTATDTVADAPRLEYDLTTRTSGNATLSLYLLPTFPIDANHRLRFAVSFDGAPPRTLDLAGKGEWQEGNAPEWENNVRRNFALQTLPLPNLAAGKHTLRLIAIDPGVVFEHIVLSFPGAPPAYPAPPATH
jgi:hypothetical protein